MSGAQQGHNGPSAFSVYASRFLSGKAGPGRVDGSQVSRHRHYDCSLLTRSRSSALHHLDHPRMTPLSRPLPRRNPTLTFPAPRALLHHPARRRSPDRAFQASPTLRMTMEAGSGSGSSSPGLTIRKPSPRARSPIRTPRHPRRATRRWKPILKRSKRFAGPCASRVSLSQHLFPSEQRKDGSRIRASSPRRACRRATTRRAKRRPRTRVGMRGRG
jgi:hypothetical protein